MTSACTLPCTQEGAQCVLLGRRALLVGRDAEARERIANMLAMLGFQVVNMASGAGGATALPAQVDIAVCAEASDLRASGALVGLLRDERPWVPLLVGTTAGRAVLVDLEHANEVPPRGAGAFATMVVRAACRVARHSRAPGGVGEAVGLPAAPA